MYSCAAVLQRNEKQIEGIRRACRLGREILDKAHSMIQPGVTTDEIDKIVSFLTFWLLLFAVHADSALLKG